MTNTWIRVAFGIVLALVLLFTVQFGVAMALPGPKPPTDPQVTFKQLTNSSDTDQGSSNRLTASIDKFYADSKDYRDEYVDYQRNAFLAGAGIAAILALVGLLLPAAVNYLRFGLLLGALLTLVWAGYIATKSVPQPAPPASSILALVAAGEPKQLDFAGRFLRFALSFVGLILLTFIGLWRLTEWPAATRRTTVTSTTAAAPAAGLGAAPVGPASPAPGSWGPPPAGTSPPAATESTTVVEETSVPRAESPPPEAVRWQRPSEGGEPAATPDTPV